MVKEKAYAKINMALEVLEEVDGYHRVNNIMVPIDIYDELTFTKSKEVYVLNDTIENNLCLRAAKLFLETYHITEGVCITLNKSIPLMAGLAGGSSDAAATLRGLNRLFEVNASVKELEKLGEKLGSDVPFFIQTKGALCTNRGECVHPFDFELPGLPVLLIKPQVGLSTKEVYQNYVYQGQRKENQLKNVIRGLKEKDIELLKKNIFNDLKESALSLSEELNSLYHRLKEMGYSVFLSGSGPTLFLLNPSLEEVEELKKKLDSSIYRTFCCIR